MYVICGQFDHRKTSRVTKEIYSIKIWIEFMKYKGETEV